MEIIYINLEKQERRKILIEKNFNDININETHTLRRFDAINVEYIERFKVPGTARPTEKAAFLSHREANKSCINTKDHYIIIEDDILLGKNTLSTLENIIKQLPDNSWDILYGEVCIPNPPDMYNMVKLKQSLVTKSNFTLIDLKNVIYAGATFYVVNKNSNKRLLNVLNSVKVHNSAIDLCIRQAVYDGKLKAFVIVPFISSFTEEAEDSTVRLEGEKATELIWMLFRKLMFAEVDYSKEQKDINYIKQNLVDEESEAFSTVLSACLCSKYTSK